MEAIAALNRLSLVSTNLVAQDGLRFSCQGQPYALPRYVFVGPKGGDEPIRVGLFAGIHGDEPEGVHALVQFVQLLESSPSLATGYCLFIYPICNPTGFEESSRNSRGGKDLNREFWKNSDAPEVRLLEAELASRSFHGIISLHTDDTSDGFYGFASGATLTTNLIEPALRSAGEFVPLNRREVIDGFTAQNSIIYRGYQNILSAPPDARPQPFEIVLETPKGLPQHLTGMAFASALATILEEYRNLMAYAPNL